MSKLINQSRLQQFATGLWAKIKERYDDAFVNATLTPAEKKIKFTKKKGGATVDVDLADYARLQDRNEFKKDVSVDDAKVVSNANIGTMNGPVSAGNRTTGYRGLTSGLFTDGYVKSLRVYLPSDASGSINAHVWMIKKGLSKAEDKFIEKIYQRVEIPTSAGTNKYIDVDIDRKFADETFFVIRTEGSEQIKGINNIKQEFENDIINVNDSFRPSSTTENIIWDNFDPRTNLVGHMELHGRTGIVDLSKKINELESGNENFVKHTDCVATGGTAGQAGKVVKLGNDGKLDNSLMPKIALNEYYEVAAFTHDELGRITYENGDVVVVNGTGNPNNGKRYLCIKKDKNQNNLTEGFVELNSKDGVVTSINGLRGEINLALAAEEARIKLDIVSGGQTVTKEIEVITTGEIDAMIAALS